MGRRGSTPAAKGGLLFVARCCGGDAPVGRLVHASCRGGLLRAGGPRRRRRRGREGRLVSRTSRFAAPWRSRPPHATDGGYAVLAAAPLGTARPARSAMGPREHRRQRGLELVRDQREELVLRPVRRLRPGSAPRRARGPEPSPRREHAATRGGRRAARRPPRARAGAARCRRPRASGRRGPRRSSSKTRRTRASEPSAI